MRQTGWDPLCSLPDAPFLFSRAWGWYHTSRPDPGFNVFSLRTAGFLDPTLRFSPRPLSFEPTLGVLTRPSGVSRPDPRGFLQETLRLRQCLVLLYAAIGIYHWILFDMLYTLRKHFFTSPLRLRLTGRQPTLFIWIARRDYGSTGHDLCFRLHKLYKLNGSFCSRF